MPSSEAFPGTSIPADNDYAEMAGRPLGRRAVRPHRRRHARKVTAADLGKRTAVRNVQLLIRLARILKLPAMVTVQYAKGLGNTVAEIAVPVA